MGSGRTKATLFMGQDTRSCSAFEDCRRVSDTRELFVEMLLQVRRIRGMRTPVLWNSKRVEHYAMAGCGTARPYADLLSDEEGAPLLQMTLEEERATDQKVTKLAKSEINIAAAK